MKLWVRLLVVASAAAVLSGCSKPVINFTRAPDVNVASEQAAGRPLELAVVVATKGDLKNKPALKAITAADWFKEADTTAAPHGIPGDQIWYYANSAKPYTQHKVGMALSGRAKSDETVPPAQFDYPDGAEILVFARYQDAQNGVLPIAPIRIEDFGWFKRSATIYVGPTALRRDDK